MSDRSRPTHVVDSPATPTPAELAKRHGLSVSGVRPGLLTYTRQVWARRHFIQAFASARLASMYANSRLGQIWQIFTPIINAAVYFVIFGVLLKTHRGIDNFVAFLCTGVFIFTFTSQAVMAGARSITGNLSLIRALHFPRASLPLAFTLMQLQQLVISMAVLMAIVLFTGEPVTVRWLIIIPVILLQGIFNAGLAMIMARLASNTLDLIQLLPFITRTWLYASGVFFSLDAFLDNVPPVVAAIMLANPVVSYIDLARYALIDSVSLGDLAPNLWLLAVGWAVVVGIGGYVFFWKAEESYGRG